MATGTTLPGVARARRGALGAGLLMALCTACGGGGGSPGSGSTPLAAPAGTASLSLLAGSAGAAGDIDGIGSAARFDNPTGITIDGAGNLYVADRGNCLVRKIAPAGAVSTLAGSPTRCVSVDGSGSAAGFAFLSALAAAPDGTIYAGDGLAIRAIAPGGAVRTVATLETGAGIAAGEASFFYVGGIAVDGGSNLYVTNGAGTRRIAAAGATTLLDGVASQDSLATILGSHAFAQRGIAVDGSGATWVANSDYTISRIDAGGTRTRIAGMSGGPGANDGSGSFAHFGQVVALSPDGTGKVWAADAGNGLVRSITSGGDVRTVAGTPGATALQLGNAPGALPALAGVVADGKGSLFAISGNAVVRIALP